MHLSLRLFVVALLLAGCGQPKPMGTEQLYHTEKLCIDAGMAVYPEFYWGTIAGATSVKCVPVPKEPSK